MKTAIPSTAKDAQNPASSSHAPFSGPRSGRLAQLAAMMNQSPRVQAQFKLAEEIQNNERVQKQRSLAAEINQQRTNVKVDSSRPRLLSPEVTEERSEIGTMPGVVAQRQPSEPPAQREEAPAPNRTGLPDQLKSGVEGLSGLSLDDVKVHYNSGSPAQLNALAYAQGSDIHVAPGQEKHLPHEAWHIVQQKQGRVQPTMQMKAVVPVNDDAGLEHEVDVMGETALSFGFADVLGPRVALGEAAAQRIVQRRTGSEKLTYAELRRALEERSEQAPVKEKASTETAEPTGEMSEAEIIKAMADQVYGRIDEAIKASEGTIDLAKELETIKVEFGLKEIFIADLGTPEAAVHFEINPWFKHEIKAGLVVWQMTGRKPTGITKVNWKSEDLKIGSQTAKVGMLMIANPLAPDFEPGSTSTQDKEQNSLMAQLANAGTTSVPNDQKYIKGHLLNDHVGGPGQSFNLFPITADANAKHLAYVEKFVKSQLSARYVIFYGVGVSFQAPTAVKKDGKAPFSIEADFNFKWHLLDTSGKPIKGIHTNKIESRYNAKGAEPFDVSKEYEKEYDKVNAGKSTPKAIPQTGQWQESSIVPSGMGKLGTVTLDPSLTEPVSLTGSSGSTTLDFTGIAVKEVSKVEYISVRNKDAPPSSAVGGQMQVGKSTAPRTVKISSISPMGGGWTRLYFV